MSKKHGYSSHYLYGTHHALIRRCEQPDHQAYKNYGGRGIRIHDQWHDVGVFISYIEEHLGPRPKGYTLDRIDNEGHYEPGNIRWASWNTQRVNARNNPKRCPLIRMNTNWTSDYIDDDLIKHYTSIEATRHDGFHPWNIIKCLQKKIASYKGYLWYRTSEVNI